MQITAGAASESATSNGHAKSSTIYYSGDVTIRISPNLETFPFTTASLLISSTSLILSSNETRLEIEYREIVLHAITSDRASIYCQLDTPDLIELFISSEDVEKIYDALSTCVSLHPDAESSTPNISEIMNGTGWITSSDAFEDADEGSRKMRRLE